MKNTQPTRVTLDKRLVSYISSLEREETNISRVNKLSLIDESGLRQLHHKGYSAQTIAVIDSFIRLSGSLCEILCASNGHKVQCGNKSFSTKTELTKYVDFLRTKKSKLLQYEIDNKETSRQ